MFPFLLFVRLKVIKIVYNIFLLFIFTNISYGNPKISLPSYQEGKEIVNGLLKNSIPIPIYVGEDKNWEILDYPPKQRILRKFVDNKEQFYYHYKVKIPVYDKNKNVINYRIEEIWLRVSLKSQILNLTFLREDLLPGNFPLYIE